MYSKILSPFTAASYNQNWPSGFNTMGIGSFFLCIFSQYTGKQRKNTGVFLLLIYNILKLFFRVQLCQGIEHSGDISLVLIQFGGFAQHTVVVF